MFDLSHVSNDVLARDLVRHATHDREQLALLLAYIAEFDARHLYLPAGYPSMFAYCVQHLHLSEEAAYVRITVARLGRVFPALFPAVADGRLHLSAIRKLAPYLTDENQEKLIADAARLKKADLEILITSRFPQPEALRLDEGIAALPVSDGVGLDSNRVQIETPTLPTAPAPTPPATVKPIAAQRFSLQVTLDGATHAKLRKAQDLLSHVTRDIGEVIERALSALIEELEKRRFAKTDHPRLSQKSARPRHIPAHVKRAVYMRDAGRCAFIAGDGRRCMETQNLEFDHVVPVALGGEATVDNLRLLCGPHNQHMAELAFGMEFMEQKRDE